MVCRRDPTYHHVDQFSSEFSSDKSRNKQKMSKYRVFRLFCVFETKLLLNDWDLVSLKTLFLGSELKLKAIPL